MLFVIIWKFDEHYTTQRKENKNFTLTFHYSIFNITERRTEVIQVDKVFLYSSQSISPTLRNRLFKMTPITIYNATELNCFPPHNKLTYYYNSRWSIFSITINFVVNYSKCIFDYKVHTVI